MPSLLRVWRIRSTRSSARSSRRLARLSVAPLVKPIRMCADRPYAVSAARSHAGSGSGPRPRSVE
jgi:hypothetical protein